MFHLDPIDEDVVLLVFVVVVEESAIKHDWVVFLRNLVGLRKITVRIVLPIKLNLRKNATTEGK